MLTLMTENMVLLLIAAAALGGLLVLFSRDPLLSGHPLVLGGVGAALAAMIGAVLAGGHLSN